jgi:hypothetical protein
MGIRIILSLLLSITFVLPAAPMSSREPTLTVDGASSVGDVRAIGDFLATQGTPGALGHGAKSDAYIVNAWRRAMVGAGEITFFDDSGASGVRVRKARGRLSLDFSGLDRFVRDFLRTGLRAEHIYFSTSLMPRALSSNPDDKQGYHFYAPSDDDAWFEAVRDTVAHIRNVLKMPGASYIVWHEPETYFAWRGKPGRRSGDLAILDDFIDLYVTTWHAVKAADPSARVGGPMTVSYTSRDYAGTGATWGMEEFLAKLAAYNKAQPRYAVTLDEVVWQHYDSNERLAVGVDHLRRILPQHGFPADTPQVVLGWNMQFMSVPIPCGAITRQQRAAFFAANIIEQLNPGGRRGLARAYMWPFDDDDVCVSTAPISVPLPERDSYDWGGYGTGDPQTRAPAITEYCMRPAHAAFQMLRQMRDGGGHFVRMSPALGPGWVQTMASSNGRQIRVVFANNTGQAHAFTLAFHNLQVREGAVPVRTQRVDGTHSADCKGLEQGARSQLAVRGGEALLPIQLSPHSVVMVTLAIR